MSNTDNYSLMPKIRRRLWAILVLLLASRFILLAILPLTDATESRYGEIARKMVETGNWVTPQYDYGVPFWGKPPLSTWLSALSIKAFGVNELAVRLPELFLGIGILWLVWHIARQRYNKDHALVSVTILATLPLFYAASGAVMTDASLAFSTTLSLAAFWLALTSPKLSQQRLWGYLFFAGEGLGLLAKGPICGVLTLGPIALWLLFGGHRQWRQVWQRLPWISGTILMLLIAAPWYLLAEQRTPGFLDYFIVGEHFRRFTETGWSGDKYGHPHKVKTGMIWLYWLADAFPWSLLLVAGLLRRWSRIRNLFSDKDGWRLFLLCWAIWPMIFFTLSHNVLYTYTLPGLPAFALLMAEYWRARVKDSQIATPMAKPWMAAFYALPVIVIVAVSVLLIAPPKALDNLTQKKLAYMYLQQRPSADSQLYYLFTRFYSAEFYSAGKARYQESADPIATLLTNNSRDYFAVKKSAVDRVPAALRKQFTEVAQVGKVVLFEEKDKAKHDKQQI